MSEETINVPKAEWEELRKLKEELPSLLEKAKEEERKDALHRLHQRDKENPEIARKRAMKRYTLNKEEINAKRREAYKLKKTQSAPDSFSPENNSPGPS
jgi:hypothetical protein